MRFYKNILVFFIFTGILWGCFNVPEFSNTPEVTFNKISRDIVVAQETGGYKDSVVISLNFKDGDGDLGYSQLEIADGAPYNFIVKQYRKVNGKYVEYMPNTSQSGHFHTLSTDKPGPLKGIIHYTGIQIYHSFYPYAKDTVKFEIGIRDRAGLISNMVMTDSVILRAL